MIYGYARVSTAKQKLTRQIENIKSFDSSAIIYTEKYTGTKLQGRNELDNLLKRIKPGDTIIFDSVSRMSRDAEEGINLYFELYDKGIELIFLNERYIDSAVYRDSIQNSIEGTGNEIADIYIEATNKVIRLLARQQIQKAFDQAEKEVLDLHTRIQQGIRNSDKHKSGEWGNYKKATYETTKSKEAKKQILAKSKDFNGTISDADLIKIIGISRNSYYKYKAQLQEEEQTA